MAAAAAAAIACQGQALGILELWPWIDHHDGPKLGKRQWQALRLLLLLLCITRTVINRPARKSLPAMMGKSTVILFSQ
jgi:hypothetical protein